MCIKRWDLGRMELLQSLNNAHKDWILGLCIINSGSVMISACRGGILRAWSVPKDETSECMALGEVRAHGSAINAVVTNQQHVFTASKSVSVEKKIVFLKSMNLQAEMDTQFFSIILLFINY